MKKTIFHLLILLPLLAAKQGVAQESDFKIEYTTEITVEKSGKGELISIELPTEPTTNNLVVLLENYGSFSTLKNNELTTFYDFNNELVLTYTPDTLYQAVPLHSVIDYRVAEYKNRSFLTGMLQAGGASDAFGDLVNLESIFGIEDEDNHTRDSIVVQPINDGNSYKVKGEERVNIQYSKTKIPKPYTEAFSKYLTYTLEIHPRIKEEILKVNRLPKHIEFYYSNVGTKTTKTFRLIEATKVPHASNNILQKKRFLMCRDNTNINGVVDSMFFNTLFGEATLSDSTFYFNQANRFVGEGKNLSGLLALFEYLLSTGNQPVKQIRAIVPHQEDDALLESFLFCLNPPTTKAEAEMKISKLDSLISQNLEFGHIMNIFAANYITPIDEVSAISYFEAALSENKKITGAWLDLGKIFASRYDFDNAWKCFGIMLNLHAEHPMAKELIARKANLKEHYPNYFTQKRN